MFGLKALKKFLRKEYRDGYLQTQVRAGIAYQIQALREKSGLNQTEFARKIGTKQSVVSRLENTDYGIVNVQTLLDIACAADVALIVRFASYPEFLMKNDDMSVAALQPQTIYESIKAKAFEPPRRKSALDQLASQSANMPQDKGFDPYSILGTPRPILSQLNRLGVMH